MDSEAGLGLGASRAQLVDLYPRLGDLLAQVEAAIARVWDDQQSFLSRAAQEVLSGRGKRLRPILLLLSAECGGGANDSSIAMAGVVEIVHAASLVHDDVIDDAPSRRGRRSAKQVWGNKVSVLLGDFLIAGAFNLLAGVATGQLMSDLARVASRMCDGQVTELRSAGQGRPVTEQQYLGVVRAKTASLFQFCCQAGVETAGGPASRAVPLGRFGENFGMAFQLADDILDLVGSDGRSGKSEGRDLAERKWTLPLIHLYQQGDQATRERLAEMLEAEQLSGHELELARDMARAAGSVEYAWARAGEWLAAAREQLAAVPEGAAKQALLLLAGERFPLPVMT